MNHSVGVLLPREDLASTHERSEVPSLERFGARVRRLPWPHENHETPEEP